MKKILILVVILSTYIYTKEPQKHNVIPKTGYISNNTVAIQIAIAVWSPIYGEKHIKSKAPFHATLKNNIWTITGLLPKRSLGGVPIMELNKTTGQILKVSHGK